MLNAQELNPEKIQFHGRDMSVLEQKLGLTIGEIKVQTILSKSGISGVDYCINPYVGCANGCRYC